jgi:NADH-quinone oxidoreductase subunit L
VPGLPLLAALVNGTLALLPIPYPWRLAQRLAWGSILLSLAGTLWVIVEVVADPAPREVAVYRWLASGDLEVHVAFLIDPLSAVMMLVVTAISFLIALFSVNYMHNEPGFGRYFCVMPVFVSAMLVLVMADNYVLLFLGWEGVGVCSYLLISFYQDRSAAAAAGTKAFCMNRIGDAGFLLGIFLIVDSFGTSDFTEVFERAGEIGTGTATAIGLLLLVGAVGKSAQLPLATWLPRAMEGPTPSSALIHAATMVTAGVYLIARSHELYAHAPDALLAVAIVGATTAVFGAVVGLVQTDIKSLLAYSTTAQLGLMFLACGLGAYAIAIFHLAAHAVFKTFLFLTAPSILHHLHPVGVRDAHAPERASRAVPLASAVFGVSALGLVAFPFLSGWWQGEVLGGAYAHGAYILLGVGGLAAFSAAFSTGRLVRAVFGGQAHGEHARPSRAASVRVLPALAVLAVLVAVGLALGLLAGGRGGTWFERFLDPVVAAAPGVPAGSPVLGAVLMVALIAFVASGWLAAVYLDRYRPEAPRLGLLGPRGLYNLALHRLWLDELYGLAVVRPVLRLGRLLERLDSEVSAQATGTSPRASEPAWWDGHAGEQAVTPPGGTAGGAAGISDGLLEHVSGFLGRFERDVIRRATGNVAGRLVELIANVSGWVERIVVDGAENLIGRLSRASVNVSATLERSVFQEGIHTGVPRVGRVLGRVLTTTEERLGHPAVVGSILLVSLAALVVGVAWR